jgi:hypothetical protein
VYDRNFLKTLGSLIIPILLFAFSQSVVYLIGWCTHFRNIKKLHKYLSLNGPLRPILILFFLETYLDLLIGGLINTENDYLFNVSGNWGINGNLSFGDQFCVILGYIFYILCLVFPFFVIYTLSMKQRSYHMNSGEQYIFDKQNSSLYDGFKVTGSGLTHYYSVYMIRRIAFISIAFTLYESHLTWL